MLSNPRHERFAQYLYEGLTADAAYERAGYKPNRHNASRLKTNETIATRVAELQDRGQRTMDITKERLTEMLLETRRAAHEANQHSAAVSAVEKIGKLHDLFVDRTENLNTNYVVYASEEASDMDEWEASVH